MNPLEKEMLLLLKRGRDQYGFLAVRAEFEAEGARSEELMRLLELGYRADLDLTIKIGGCEAITDLQRAKQLGAKTIIAPMIKSTFALTKYLQSIDRAYDQQAKQETEFLFNIETIQGYEQREAICTRASENGLSGVVFGRVDFCASLSLSRNNVNTQQITQKVKDVALLCREKKMSFVLGGGVDVDSIGCMKAIQEVHLDRYETRKIAIDGEALKRPTALQGLIEASRFELLWLRNKKNYYQAIASEDQTRIKMLERRVMSLAA